MLHERLLREPPLDLEKAVQAGLSTEESKKHSKIMAMSETENISIIKEKRQNTTKSKTARQENKTQYWIEQCNYCSKAHNKNNCPAFSKNCNKCRKKGHFAKMCKTRMKKLYKVKKFSSSSSPENSDHEMNTVHTKKHKNN